MNLRRQTWVKVCGLTREADVAVAVQAGADAVGFVIAPNSPRAVTIDRARELAVGVTAQPVLVSVDLTPDEVLDTARSAGISGVQPHGRSALAAAVAAVRAGLFVLQPAPVARPFVVPEIADGALALFDTADPERHGGTGRTFQWDLVAPYRGDFVMAGGLGPDNVAAAVAAVRPFGVDASSGLEREAGIKDHGKVTAFIEEAKTA